MKHLFLARHGAHDYDWHLNEAGRKQMKALGTAIKEILNGGSAYVLTSEVLRALESSEILAALLGLPGPEKTFLLQHAGLTEKLAIQVKENEGMADGLILVTHQDVIGGFAEYFLPRELGRDLRQDDLYQIGALKSGRAIHLDRDAKNYRIIPME